MTTTNIQKKGRSKKYLSNLAKVQELQTRLGSSLPEVKEAVQLLFDLDQPKFENGASVELHVKLNINPTKSDQLVRSSVVLPHGTGKKIRIAAFVNPEKEAEAKKAGADVVGSDELIDQIKNSGKVDFDIAIAQPEMMKKLPVIARLLGTAGVMPNPKTGTVGDDIQTMIKLIRSGKVDFRNDKSGNIHIPCGKINRDFNVDTITENVLAALEAVEKAKPEAIKKKFVLSAHLSSTHSPSIKIR
jgi:large subunit ribosomal protein L1